MKRTRKFPDLIKAGLKKGDTVYSYLYGEGTVVSTDATVDKGIEVAFNFGHALFNGYGYEDENDLIPSIHLSPWDPVSGEPFPFPKFDLVVGDVYAFWNDDDAETFGFRIGTLTEINGSDYVIADRLGYDNCAPISEAMEIFGFNDKMNQP